MAATETFSEEKVNQVTAVPAWKASEKFAFRVVCVFVALLCLPFSTRFYTNLYQIDWAAFNWLKLSGIASGFGAPEFIKLSFEQEWGLFSYINVAITFVVSVLLGGAWTLLDRKRTNYRDLFYWVLVIARYRMAFGIIAWGYKKLIPIQMEPPSLTFHETPFLDFSEQKLYWQGVGIAQPYEVFLGAAEVLAGVLLLFRATTALGAAFTAVLLANIVIANHVYEGMVHVHSFVFVLLSLIVLAPYWPNIWRLLVKEQDTLAVQHYPVFTLNQQYFRTGLKVAGWGIFVFFLLYLHAIDDLGYRYPHNSPGLKNAAGVYHVTEFRINNKVVPYNPLDSVRWQDAIFEKWSTLTFKVNRKQHMDLENTGKEGKESISKRYEFRGIGGGRHYFDYQIDEKQQVLHLQNKNKAHRGQKQVLHYSRPTPSRLVLFGLNEFNDYIYVVLDKVVKKYPLYQSRDEPRLSQNL